MDFDGQQTHKYVSTIIHFMWCACFCYFRICP